MKARTPTYPARPAIWLRGDALASSARALHGSELTMGQLAERLDTHESVLSLYRGQRRPVSAGFVAAALADLPGVPFERLFEVRPLVAVAACD